MDFSKIQLPSAPALSYDPAEGRKTLMQFFRTGKALRHHRRTATEGTLPLSGCAAFLEGR
jgi:hypothetical protein